MLSVVSFAVTTSVLISLAGPIVGFSTGPETGAAECEAPAPGEGKFTWGQGTTYTDELIDNASRAYRLTGCTPYGVSDLAAMRLSGAATLLIAYKGQELRLGADSVALDASGGYAWTFSLDNVPSGDIGSVAGIGDHPVTLSVSPHNGAYREALSFQLGLNKPATFEPNLVQIRTIIFSQADAPYVDVFHRIGHAQERPYSS